MPPRILNMQESSILYIHQQRLHERAVLLDLLTQVLDYPTLELPDYIKLPDKDHLLTLNLDPSGADNLVTKRNREFILSESDTTNLRVKELLDKGLQCTIVSEDFFYSLRSYLRYQLQEPNTRMTIDEEMVKRTGVDNFQLLDLLFQREWERAENNGQGAFSGVLVKLVQASTKQSVIATLLTKDLKNKQLEFQYVADKIEGPLFHSNDRLMIDGSHTRLLSGDTKIETTVGRYIYNIVTLDMPFKEVVFQYHNEAPWKASSISNMVKEALLAKKITSEEVKAFFSNWFFLGHFNELACPSLSPRAFTTHPDSAKVKKALMEKHKDNLDSPEAIKEIDDALNALDLEWLKTDPDEHPAIDYYNAMGSKALKIQRKQLFATMGGMEDFSSKGGYKFIANSLAEGWDIKNLKYYINATRSASYYRGINTAKSGVQIKYGSSVFRDVSIIPGDCGTTRGLPVDFSLSKIKNFIGLYIIESGNKLVEITEENMANYDGKKVIIRSPMECQQPGGNWCQTCCGTFLQKRGTTNIAMLITAISETSFSASMSKMHGSELKLYELTDLSKFIIE